MVILTSRHTGPLALPGGQLFLPNEPTPVHNWGRLSGIHCVKRWIASGVLEVSEAPAGVIDPDPFADFIEGLEDEPETQPEEPAGDEKDELIAALAARGINKDRRSKVETLRKLLKESE